MTGDDLKRLQGLFLEGGQEILRERGTLRPVGFVITSQKHLEKLLETGWGAEFLGDPKLGDAFVRDPNDDRVAALVLDLLLDWKRLYHATLHVFPTTRDMLPDLIRLAEEARVDNPYKRVMRPFLKHAKLDEKDVVAKTLSHVCSKVEAFACIMQSEAWLRTVSPTEDESKIPDDLGEDAQSVEIIFSSMETYDFTRLITLPIHRARSQGRAEGALVGFGAPTESLDTPQDTNVIRGRFVQFLKPLPPGN